MLKCYFVVFLVTAAGDIASWRAGDLVCLAYLGLSYATLYFARRLCKFFGFVLDLRGVHAARECKDNALRT
jgi:hypothetical protein